MARGKYQKWITHDGLLILGAWARDGYTDEQIAAKIGINRTTLYDWEKRFPDVSNAIKNNKDVVDIQVENALWKRAVGYDVEETVEIKSDKGNSTKTVRRHVAPDVIAGIFWLKNRRPDKWRDKQEVEVKGELSMTTALKAARERVIKNK